VHFHSANSIAERQGHGVALLIALKTYKTEVRDGQVFVDLDTRRRGRTLDAVWIDQLFGPRARWGPGISLGIFNLDTWSISTLDQSRHLAHGATSDALPLQPDFLPSSCLSRIQFR